MLREPIPLKERKADIGFIAFYVLNITFITYVIDIEQLIIADPTNFVYPIWPPAPMVDLIHWYGSNFDPPLMARPAWWRATIWIDQLFFGPFYAVAIYAYIKSKDWIRIPSIIWASVMLTNVAIILFEEAFGVYAADDMARVLLANLLWFTVPVLVIRRMWKPEHPFTRAVGET